MYWATIAVIVGYTLVVLGLLLLRFLSSTGTLRGRGSPSKGYGGHAFEV